jgi:Family of unknown function (DUF6084)
MVDLTFSIEGAEVDRFAAAPSLNFTLRIAGESPNVRVENVLLYCQIRIEPTRRTYTAEEREELTELFGATHRWKDTLQSMLWTHTNVQVPAFEGQRLIELPVPCSFDFNIAATKYFFGLDSGAVPLALLFSGTVFYRDAGGFLQMDLISWNKEASFQLPVRVWHELMELYYPNTAWLRVDRGVFQEIYRYKRARGFTGFDETLRSLMAGRNEDSLP